MLLWHNSTEVARMRPWRYLAHGLPRLAQWVATSRKRWEGSDGRRKRRFPCQIFPLEERLNEKEARCCRCRGRSWRSACCACADCERHAVWPVERRPRMGQRCAARRLEPERDASQLELLALRHPRHRVARGRAERALPHTIERERQTVS